ncbi:MAG: helix-hairpin-helix domain-containing protein [Geminicoccaceae bacterium]|nr:helix-hairpin-helix domain-containing protein [Geminicoccaceae bacterium]MDW8369470.1 helix-hairpin-helix domain-containing protein [Geminicoccaceae bacterium]
MSGGDGLNARIAERLRRAADLLEAQGANPFRVGAYRRAAETVAALERPVEQVWREGGAAALEALPGIGPSLARALVEMITTGRWAQLERLEGAVAPEALFATVPGIGPKLARDIHEHLHIDTLEDLELAAHDGRLLAVPGIGPRRAAQIRASLAEILSRARPWRRGAPAEEPEVGVLLDVDEEYRRRAAAEDLPKIAPRRFNPNREAWLPVLHTRRGPWYFTALFSNTARAHELGRIGDWVVIYFEKDDAVSGQRTIVTEQRGPLAGRRVVRGRERDSLRYYRSGPGGGADDAAAGSGDARGAAGRQSG